MRKGEDVQHSSFDLLLGVASNVMHSQRLHSFTIVHMPQQKKTKQRSGIPASKSSTKENNGLERSRVKKSSSRERNREAAGRRKG